jgi:hypothetical protein
MPKAAAGQSLVAAFYFAQALGLCSMLLISVVIAQALGSEFAAAHLALGQCLFPDFLILAWGMRDATASSHRFLSESPLAANQPGSLALNRQDDAASEHLLQAANLRRR